jgi:hypothetical protein
LAEIVLAVARIERIEEEEPVFALQAVQGRAWMLVPVSRTATARVANRALGSKTVLP